MEAPKILGAEVFVRKDFAEFIRKGLDGKMSGEYAQFLNTTWWGKLATWLEKYCRTLPLESYRHQSIYTSVRYSGPLGYFLVLNIDKCSPNEWREGVMIWFDYDARSFKVEPCPI